MNNEIHTQLLQKHLKHAKDPLSAEALLDPRELEFRTVKTRIIGGPCKGVAEFIVHELLDDIKKKTIFTSPYELGNPEILNEKAVRQGPLVNYLEHQYNDIEIKDVESVLKLLKRVVRDLTGHEFRSYTQLQDDKRDLVKHSFAIKALCTLYRYRTWEPKIFSRFSKPKSPDNCNLELRDSYPLHWSDDSARTGVALFSDLKQSLTFGMSMEEVRTILPIMEKVSIRYLQSIFSPPEVLALYLNNPNLENIHLLESDIMDILPLGDDEIFNRLDIDLYIRLVLRAVELRLLGKERINQFLVSQDANVPVFREWSLEKLVSIIRARKNEDAIAFKDSVQLFIGKHLTDEEIEMAFNRAGKLALIFQSPIQKDKRLNYLEELAAFIACIESVPVRTKAYWYGKENSSNNPLFYLDSLENVSSLDNCPEHYQEYWYRRYMLVMYRLVGKEDLWLSHIALEQFEGKQIIRVFQTHDTFSAIKIIENYIAEVPDSLVLTKRLKLVWADN